MSVTGRGGQHQERDDDTPENVQGPCRIEIAVRDGFQLDQRGGDGQFDDCTCNHENTHGDGDEAEIGRNEQPGSHQCADQANRLTDKAPEQEPGCSTQDHHFQHGRTICCNSSCRSGRIACRSEAQSKMHALVMVYGLQTGRPGHPGAWNTAAAWNAAQKKPEDGRACRSRFGDA